VRVQAPSTVWTLLVFVAAVVVALLFAHGPDRWTLGGGALLLCASLAVVCGRRYAWMFLAVVAAGDLLLFLVAGSSWPALAVNAVMLALLLAPATRDHVRIGGRGN
jgi:hypothetical protein